jgi:hypothetical protein
MSNDYDLDLFDREFVSTGKNRASIAERFAKFHAANPDIYSELVALARMMRDKSNRKIGIAMLFEVLRWNYYTRTASDEEYKLSNDFRAPYARLIMEQEADMSGAFTIKPSVVDSVETNN